MIAPRMRLSLCRGLDKPRLALAGRRLWGNRGLRGLARRPRRRPPVSAPRSYGTLAVRSAVVSFRAAGPHKIPIDPNGNLATKTEGTDTWAYTWNAENQLTRVTKNSVEQARFAYDPLGRRVEKVASGVTTNYTYDRRQILREARGALLLRHVQGPRYDEPLAVEDGAGARTYYHADGLGSIVKGTDQGGAAALDYRYDAWGRRETSVGEPGTAFTGREWDPAIDLYYYRARYYAPELGRFLGEDPVARKGDNRYAYAGGAPTLKVDPLGWFNVGGDEVCPTARFKGNRASTCCRNGEWVPCFSADYYSKASDAAKACSAKHEWTHIEDMKRAGCTKCCAPSCTPVGCAASSGDECAPAVAKLMCLLDSGRATSDEVDDAANKVWIFCFHAPPPF